MLSVKSENLVDFEEASTEVGIGDVVDESSSCDDLTPKTDDKKRHTCSKDLTQKKNLIHNHNHRIITQTCNKIISQEDEYDPIPHGYPRSKSLYPLGSSSQDIVAQQAADYYLSEASMIVGCHSFKKAELAFKYYFLPDWIEFSNATPNLVGRPPPDEKRIETKWRGWLRNKGKKKGLKEERVISGLKLFGGGSTVPRADKALNGGEDGFFFDNESGAAGVADGVGAWASHGATAGPLAMELMKECRSAAISQRKVLPTYSEDNIINTKALASQILQNGFKNTKTFGSTTAVVAAVNPLSSRLGIAIFGDSRCMVLRWIEKPKPEPANKVFNKSVLQEWLSLQLASKFVEDSSRPINKKVKRVFFSEAWEFHFNAPYQLYRLPDLGDRKYLRETGKEQVLRHLVDVIPTCANVVAPVEAAKTSSVDIEEGDLILLGSDGLFDNLFEETIRKLLKPACSPYSAAYDYGDPSLATDPQYLAQVLTQAAYNISRNSMIESPFSLGYNMSVPRHHSTIVGGKPDDITAVCCWVVRSEHGEFRYRHGDGEIEARLRRLLSDTTH